MLKNKSNQTQLAQNSIQSHGYQQVKDNPTKRRIKKWLQHFPRIKRIVYSLASIIRIVQNGFLFKLAIQEEITGRRKILTPKECTYFGDGFGTIHHVSFLHDTKFINAYKNAFDKTPKALAWEGETFNIAWRAHITTWAATQALKLEGDFVECGVWYGLLSKTICEYTDFEKQNRTFYLFDNWGEEAYSDEAKMNPEYSKDIYEIVKERFNKYPNVKLIRGLVPDVLEKVDIKKIAYLGIDMNGHIPERKTLEKYYERVVSGGVIYFDDYGWGYPKLRETVEDFFSNKPESLLHFPSGNSIVVKL